MSRVNRMQSGNTNPASKFLSWKSQHQKFAYYDKEKKENIFIEMPFKFLAISRYKTVKGWNQKKEGSIISNEVKSLNDEIRVNFYPKNGDKYEICRGPWVDIKETVDNWDGKYTESVYVMLPDGELANLQLSGASLSTWFEFQKNQTDKFFDNWVVINGFKEGKQGAVTFTYPVFEWGSTLKTEEQKLAEGVDKKIEDYEAHYFGNQEEEPSRSRSEVDKYEMEHNKPPVPPNAVDSEIAMYEDLNKEDDLPY